MIDIGDIGYQLRYYAKHLRQRWNLFWFKRRNAYVCISQGTPQWARLVQENRRKRRETPGVVHYLSTVSLKPEVMEWFVAESRSNVSMLTIDRPDSIYIFFRDPDEALAFRMRWT